MSEGLRQMSERLRQMSERLRSLASARLTSDVPLLMLAVLVRPDEGLRQPEAGPCETLPLEVSSINRRDLLSDPSRLDSGAHVAPALDRRYSTEVSAVKHI